MSAVHIRGNIYFAVGKNNATFTAEETEEETENNDIEYSGVGRQILNLERQQTFYSSSIGQGEGSGTTQIWQVIDRRHKNGDSATTEQHMETVIKRADTEDSIEYMNCRITDDDNNTVNDTNDTTKQTINKAYDLVNNTNYITNVDYKNDPFWCQLCDYKTVHHSNLTKHLRDVHGKGKLFICEVCNYKSLYKSHLAKHIRGVHGKVNQHNRQMCDHKPARKMSLIGYIEGINAKDEPFMCQICDYKSVYLSNITKHLRHAHGKVEPYNCEMCDYKSMDVLDLMWHARKAHIEEKVLSPSNRNDKRKRHLTVRIRAVREKEEFQHSDSTESPTAVHNKTKVRNCSRWYCESIDEQSTLSRLTQHIHDKDTSCDCQLCDLIKYVTNFNT